MKLRRKTSLLRQASIDSLSLTVELFNRPSAVGRTAACTILAAHGIEMLLKAMIFQERRTLRDPGADHTYSLERCIRISRDNLGVLDQDQAAVLLGLKQNRDAAAHEYIEMDEDLLWLTIRSFVTVFGAVYESYFGQAIEDLLPARSVPISAAPPTDIALVVDREMEQLRALLAPGSRKSAEARARLRPLLALDGGVGGREEAVSEIEVGRAEGALKAGKDWRFVFPGLASLEVVAAPREAATRIHLRVGRDREGLPVRLASPDEEDEALIFREVNFFDKYSIRLSRFGELLGLNRSEGLAVISALDLKANRAFYYQRETARGNVQFQGLSLAALARAREALASGELDLGDAVAAYRSRGT